MAFPVRILTANEGRSPATEVRIDSKITFSDISDRTEKLGREIDNSCEATKLFVPDFALLTGRTIRPSEPYVQNMMHTVSNGTIRSHIIGAVDGELFNPVLIGCVAYTIPYSTRVHHTPFAFDIVRRPKVPFPPGDVFILGATVPQEEIFFVRDENALAHRPPD
jgi:hypothetical protein